MESLRYRARRDSLQPCITDSARHGNSPDMRARIQLEGAGRLKPRQQGHEVDLHRLPTLRDVLLGARVGCRPANSLYIGVIGDEFDRRMRMGVCTWAAVDAYFFSSTAERASSVACSEGDVRT